jgi:hypothetical protein
VDTAPPGPYEGKRFLSISRATTGTGAKGTLSIAQTTTGQVIHCELMIHIPSRNGSGTANPAFACQVLVGPGDRIILSNGQIASGGGDVLNYAGSHRPTGLRFAADTWQRWEIDYAVGAATFNLAIDGEVATGLAANAPGDVGEIWLTNGTNNCRYWVDAVPGLLDPMLRITWHLGPDLPQGFQDSDGGIVDNTLITVAGFCQGEDVPSKPGKYPRGFLQQAWGLDLAHRAAGWVSLPAFPGHARQELFGAVVADELYLWGGISYSTPNTYADGWKLSHAGGTWTWQALPGLPWPLCAGAVAVIGTRIYVMGGADYDGAAFYTANNRSGTNPNLGAHLITFDTAGPGAGWQMLPDCPGTPRWVHAMGSVDQRLYVIGGATGNSCTVTDNWRFEPATAKWVPLADLPISSGNFPSGSSIVFENRYLVLPGGFQFGCTVRNGSSLPPYGTGSKAPQPGAASQVYFNDVFVYDTRTDRFGRADPLPLNNNLPMTVLAGSELFLVGGETGGARLLESATGAGYSPAGEYFGHHPDLLLTGRIEVATVRADLDRDRDVDAADLTALVGCLGGPGRPLPVPDCAAADQDHDADVDQDDFGLFQRCLTGPDGPVTFGCEP